MMDSVRYICEGWIDVALSRFAHLEVDCPRHACNVYSSCNAATLSKNAVVRCAGVQMSLGDGLLHPSRHVRGIACTCVLRELSVLGSLSIQTHGGEETNRLLPAGVLEIHAVDAKQVHVCGLVVGIHWFHSILIHRLLKLHPCGGKVSTVAAPVRVEVNHCEVMCVHHALEIVMLEVVTRRSPIRVQFRKLLRREASVAELQFAQLFLFVRLSFSLPFVVNSLLIDILGDVEALRAKSVPNTYCQMAAVNVQHGDIKIDRQQLILVAVDHNLRGGSIGQKRGGLTPEEHQACRNGHQSHDSPGRRGL
mmetsp:Transcript_4538/g.10616  ORF Transcript_4538/g.10616 Transcript_4538/m.10616 type:complete len:307 (-) Transcript_4538:166-1086(-)